MNSNLALGFAVVAVLAAIGAYIWLWIGFNRSTINVNQINARGTGSLDIEGVGVNNGVVTADTINEKTSGAGVTVESVAMEDGAVRQARATVTQITDIETGVTINAPVGVITTVNTTLGAGLSASFTVTNSFAKADSVPALTFSYGGTGNVQLSYAAMAEGSFTITIKNTHASAALNNIILIGFSLA